MWRRAFLFFSHKNWKMKAVWFRNKHPGLTGLHKQDTVVDKPPTTFCYECVNIWWRERTEGFRMSFPERKRGKKRKTIIPDVTLSVLPALGSCLSLEVGGVPKSATQHACQQPGLSLIHSQRGSSVLHHADHHVHPDRQ